ncbi:MAG: hypothetical protein IT374_10285 [Polyangiaceae bacterium]|nr:hypothetical protein [Polyangiaceae bacterium]
MRPPVTLPTHPAPRLRRLGLGFEDRALEREFLREQALERAPMIRGAVGLLFAFSALFGLVDAFVFTEVRATLLPARAVMLALLLPTGPLVFGRGSDRHLARHAHEILLYQAVVGVGSLLVMGWLTLARFDESERMLALMASMFTLLCLYFVSGIRASYAALVGVGGSVALAALAYAHVRSANEAAIAGAFLAGQNLIGLGVSFSLEGAARRGFVQRRRLEDARRRTEALLLNVVPASHVEALKARDGDVIARRARASIVFATLTGFDDATARLSPVEAVQLLDRIVSRFDEVTVGAGGVRIKTVGATYMAAAGLDEDGADDATIAATVALALREAARAFSRDRALPIALRVGIARGPIVAGVLGTRRIAFDCWGDTANLAARLDTHGAPDAIQISLALADALPPGARVRPRGQVRLKGKGDVETAWLEGLA